MSVKPKDKIQIQFVGEAASGVTGSCIWVKTPHVEFLIECGLYQSSGNILDEYKINNAPFKFKPKNISYVFALHNHGDHVLRIPLLFKRGMRAPVIAPAGSSPISRILMEDSARIMACDAADLSKQYGREYAPIYTQDHVDLCLAHFREYPMGELIQLDEYVKFRFVPSGHILNAAQIEIYVTEGNVTKCIAYTSDLGNTHIDSYYANTFEPIRRANVFIGETTYGGEYRIATQRIRDKDLAKLKAVIEHTCIENRGRVLIPCFANSRSQIMLTHLYDLFGNDPKFRVPVLFDTPMGVRVCEAYKQLLPAEDAEKWDEVLQWRNVKFITDPIESKAWQNDDAPAVIISSSGMLTHGRSRAYTKALLGDSRNTIIFCGFSVDNSLASIIKQGKVRVIKLGGKKVPNMCNVVDLHSFTSHAQRDSLLQYYSSVDCEKVLLVHGDMDGKVEFAADLEEAISKNNKTSKVVCVNKGYSLSI